MCSYIVSCTIQPGAGIYHPQGSSGASSAGLGGRGGCEGYLTCRLKRNLPYGDLYHPDDFGSGGALYNGGTGKNYKIVCFCHLLKCLFCFGILL